MSNGNQGLRFDIYERVHLPDNVAGIDELEEIELVPRIQVIEQGENAILQGQLVLNGIYRAQGTEGEQVALEHWIPVEITLPLNRVTTLSEVTVDIDTFDVVLLSSRALNLTGILSLRGIVLEQEESNSWDSEVFTVSHSRGSDDQDAEYAYEEQEKTEQQAQNEYYDSNENGLSFYAEEVRNAQEEAEEAERVEAEKYEGQQLSYLQQLELRYGQLATQEEQYQRSEQQEQYEQYEQYEQQEQYEQYSQEADDTQTEVNEQEVLLTRSSDNKAANEEESVRYTESENKQDSNNDVYAPLQTVYAATEEVDSRTEQEEQFAEHNNNEEIQWSSSSWDTPKDAEDSLQQEERESTLQSLQLDEENPEQVPELEKVDQSLAEPPIERELHIALNANQKEQNEVLGIRTILNSSLREQAAQQAASLQQEQERERDEQEKKRSNDEQIEWKQLFLSKRQEQNEFKRIRMCIVQKEDTLEQIASRYSVNPRDILQHNNLFESAITEGQLLYIP